MFNKSGVALAAGQTLRFDIPFDARTSEKKVEVNASTSSWTSARRNMRTARPARKRLEALFDARMSVFGAAALAGHPAARMADKFI